MQINGAAKRKNLKGNEKIKDEAGRGNVGKDHQKNVGQAQTLTVDGVDYLLRASDGPICGDNGFNKFNNKNVDAEGVFVGPIFVVSSWDKVK